MCKYLSLTLIFSICRGDTLILKNKEIYNGELIKYVNGKKILFKALPSANILIDIDEVQKLTLTDGTKIFENGKILIYTLNDTKKFKEAKKAASLKSFIGCTTLLLLVALLISNLEIDVDSGNGSWLPGDNIDLDH